MEEDEEFDDFMHVEESREFDILGNPFRVLSLSR
jgi:hypothetical protein